MFTDKSQAPRAGLGVRWALCEQLLHGGAVITGHSYWSLSGKPQGAPKQGAKPVGVEWLPQAARGRWNRSFSHSSQEPGLPTPPLCLSSAGWRGCVPAPSPVDKWGRAHRSSRTCPSRGLDRGGGAHTPAAAAAAALHVPFVDGGGDVPAAEALFFQGVLTTAAEGDIAPGRSLLCVQNRAHKPRELQSEADPGSRCPHRLRGQGPGWRQATSRS